MDEPRLRNLLRAAAGETVPPLPGRFTDDVIRQTRRREFVQAQLAPLWPILTAASVLAISVAGGTGLWMARDRGVTSPPPLTLFQAQPDTVPFLAP